MTLSADIKSALEASYDLGLILAGGIHSNVEEISRQNTPTAFDANDEIQPCALIKIGVESRLRSGIDNSVNTPLVIYFYERQGYTHIEAAMEYVFAILNEQKVGENVWNIEFDIAVNQQRDTALDCALGSLRFVAKRLR